MEDWQMLFAICLQIWVATCAVIDGDKVFARIMMFFIMGVWAIMEIVKF